MNNKKAVELKNISKIYGKRHAVDNLSFYVEEGDILGLIGPNGAGKSTTIKITLKLINKNSGTVKIEDYDLDTSYKKAIKHISFTSESPSFYEYLNGYENLRLVANLHKTISNDTIFDLLKSVGLIESYKKKVKTYSTGMKQRLGLARAMLSNPKIILLDEPTNGLDPRGMNDIYNLIKKLNRENKTTFIISSHLLHDIEKICNKVVLIDNGKTIFNGDMQSVLNKNINLFNIYTSNNSEAAELIKELDGVICISNNIDSITMKINSNDIINIDSLKKLLLKNSIQVTDVEKIKPSLETLFFLMTKED
ncbi:ABC transporter ATP-binding protein [Clostridium luticellarii]|jgi:ABC-2 type transport system ATP-binding protein|uniref:Putative ABC transporter ATP-binding protein YxlF n=1 Tax=Clostridium luticellarii TaxID=1691940 RepID=A0A2T0BD28_9CLOT|nr:ABC transporter ATP-binding protein [Clostridium luticellarii]MCI1945340.1 ABC transporter ATP-binding protein [Clostridium luticellarii]MCI1968695.1 ABC transporter ATP-binding protein [Clostridium luticellarii]MCI1996141.1 ABC transporter ATP-binding protein [Clostridium luticellarii]MCI2040389.1 ABC transporter ATP-binding protein [Clostridium luticellarii]PRR81742.1 putative ABC transporter ATP-binding protein YxlF [Clostridium luticellarii]